MPMISSFILYYLPPIANASQETIKIWVHPWQPKLWQNCAVGTTSTQTVLNGYTYHYLQWAHQQTWLVCEGCISKHLHVCACVWALGRGALRKLHPPVSQYLEQKSPATDIIARRFDSKLQFSYNMVTNLTFYNILPAINYLNINYVWISLLLYFLKVIIVHCT